MIKEGFYWVKYQDRWEVAEYMAIGDHYIWLVTGSEEDMNDALQEIDERQIVRAEPIITEANIIKFGLFGNPQDYTPEHYD